MAWLMYLSVWVLHNDLTATYRAAHFCLLLSVAAIHKSLDLASSFLSVMKEPAQFKKNHIHNRNQNPEQTCSANCRFHRFVWNTCMIRTFQLHVAKLPCVKYRFILNRTDIPQYAYPRVQEHFMPLIYTSLEASTTASQAPQKQLSAFASLFKITSIWLPVLFRTRHLWPTKSPNLLFSKRGKPHMTRPWRNGKRKRHIKKSKSFLVCSFIERFVQQNVKSKTPDLLVCSKKTRFHLWGNKMNSTLALEEKSHALSQLQEIVHFLPDRPWNNPFCD